jgi:hypothetical protein
MHVEDNPGAPFTNVQSYYYWSVTSCAGNDDDARNIDIEPGILDGNDKSGTFCVWPVRDSN